MKKEEFLERIFLKEIFLKIVFLLLTFVRGIIFTACPSQNESGELKFDLDQ